MKKIIYKFIALFIAFSSVFIEKTFGSCYGNECKNLNNLTEDGINWLAQLLNIFIWILLILSLFLPYWKYKNFIKLNDEKKININKFIKYEKYIFYSLFYIILLLFFILQKIQLQNITNILLYLLILTDYIINLIYGIYLYREKDKIFAKKYLENSHIFTIIYFIIIYAIFSILNLIYITR